MFELDVRTQAIPDEMHYLLDRYPRESWDENPHFKQITKNWLAAHQSFRDLVRHLVLKTEQFINADIPEKVWKDHLDYFGYILKRNLTAHHAWEDASYFPELLAADPRFADAIAILESDHHQIDILLGEFDTSKRALLVKSLRDQDSNRRATKILRTISTLERSLGQHLTDEEEIAVPIILQYKLRD
jgi:iron-sulfur cluster repair protein YtfE (RIC family)